MSEPSLKRATEMDFNEFHEWGTQRLADAVITGGFKEMSSAFHLILQQVAQNERFGGGKK